MRGDPRKGVIVSLLIAGAAGLWVLVAALAGDAMHDAIGGIMFPITFLAIFAAVSALGVAALFWRYLRVRSDLLAGRNVIAQWHLDEADLDAARPTALTADRRAKRGALVTILVFVALIFGAFAVFDPDAAPIMLAVAGFVVLSVVLAYWLGNRATQRQWQMASGEVIVGRDGLLFNGTLHIWSTMMSGKVRAGFDEGPPPLLAVRYSYVTRAGMQPVTVILPVPTDAIELARSVPAKLRQRRR